METHWCETPEGIGKKIDEMEKDGRIWYGSPEESQLAEFEKAKYKKRQIKLMFSYLPILVFIAIFIAHFRGNTSFGTIIAVIFSTALMVLFSYGFFFLRHYMRKIYGSIEIIIGTVTISVAMFKIGVFNDHSFLSLFSGEVFPYYLGIGGGMYIIIRGLDNLGVAPPPETLAMFGTSSNISAPAQAGKRT